jgi:hypothetical protein
MKSMLIGLIAEKIREKKIVNSDYTTGEKRQ